MKSNISSGEEEKTERESEQSNFNEENRQQ